MKYTILIPTYKVKYLQKCIDSILNQTFDDFEIVVVNDASPENVDEVINSYRDDRIKYYVNEKNCGAVNVVDNWNICLSYAAGDYVMCIGDDDELSTDCLEQYNRLIDKYPHLNIYHGRVMIIDEESNFYNLQEVRPEFESVYSLIWHRLQGRIQYIGDFLYRRTTLLANGGFYKLPLAWGSDDISAFIAAEQFGIANTEKPIFYYRTNRLSITTGGNFTTKVDSLNSECMWCKSFIENRRVEGVDNYYIQLIRKGTDKAFNKKKIAQVAKDLKSNKLRFLFWLRNRNKFGLPLSSIIHALAISANPQK